MVKWLCVMLASLASLGASAGVEQDDETRRVQEDVTAIVHALYAGDVDTVLRFTHPTIVQMQGGMQPTRGAIQQAVARLKSAGMRVESLTFPEPPVFLNGPDRRFAVVPTLSVIVANGQRVESLNFQLGVLERDATQWHYVEGSRIDSQKVQTLFPGFPAGYEFPPLHREKL